MPKSLAEHCEWAARVVATWPAWKRNILGDSLVAQREKGRAVVAIDDEWDETGDLASVRVLLREARACARHFYRDAVSNGPLESDDDWRRMHPWLEKEDSNG